MLRNYLIIAWRQILRGKGYAALNVAGLAVGITCCLLILQYVAHEKSYDQFHPRGKHIYRLRLDSYQNGRLAWQSATVYPAFAPTMKRDFPEVVETCRLHDVEFVLTNPENNVKFTEKKGYYADASFLSMFSLPFREGDPATALVGPDKIILSESMARKYFGDEAALGRRLLAKDAQFPRVYEVTGVFADYPANSHLVLDYLVSYGTLKQILIEAGDTTNAAETAWGWYDFYTYLELRPGTDITAFQARFPAFVDKYINEPWRQRVGTDNRNVIDLIPMPDIHLHSNVNQEAEVNGSGRAVSVLFLVALFILGIAWINYINLATARSLDRAREVGLRKVLGAHRRELIGQFLMESVLLNTAAFWLAMVLMRLTLPLFNRLFGQELTFNLAAQPRFWLAAVSVFLAGAVLAGVYPSLVLSGFRPLAVIGGKLKHSVSGIWLRKGLIVFQFVASVALISGTIVVYRQVQFMRQQDIGVNIDKTLVLTGAETVLDSVYEGQFQSFREEVMKIAGVKSATASAYVPGDEIYWTNSTRRLGQGNAENNNVTLYTQGVDEHFLPAYELPLVAGRNFARTRGEDARACLLNERAAAILGFPSAEAALNERLRRGGDTLLVIGVTKDFHHLGLQKAIDPLIFLYRPNARGYYSLKMEDGADVAAILPAVQRTWTDQFPADPFHYFFLNEFFDEQYRAELIFGRVFGFFTLLAILVATLGLLGLSSYNVLQRTKEIGIRKVLGASVAGIVGLLSRDFLRLVLTAFLIASPLAWYAMRQWLAGFAYRIDIGWWVFALAGAIAFLIAFVTVTLQSMKAALVNPVETLRSE